MIELDSCLIPVILSFHGVYKFRIKVHDPNYRNNHTDPREGAGARHSQCSSNTVRQDHSAFESLSFLVKKDVHLALLWIIFTITYATFGAHQAVEVDSFVYGLDLQHEFVQGRVSLASRW